MSDTPRRHGPALFALFAVAVCEWFAYWAVRSQIVTELAARLGDQEAAGRAYGLFVIGSTGVPLLAGIAVDLGGSRRMAIAGAALLAAGLLAVALPVAAAVYAGLGLVVAGKGLVQIGVLALVADLHAPGDHRRDAGFTLAWAGINVGAALATIGAGLLATYVSGAASFGAAAALAVAGALLLARLPATEQHAPAPGSWVLRAVATFAVLSIVVLFVEAALEASSLVAALSRGWTGGLADPATRELVAIIAFALAVLLLPLFVAWLWLRLGPRQPSSPAKILLGALLTAAVMILIAALALDQDGGLPASLWRSTSGMFVEILIAPIAVSLISRVAPPHLRGTALGLWASSSLAAGHASPWVQRTLFETELVSVRFFLPAVALAAGVVGYALLALLGLTRRDRA